MITTQQLRIGRVRRIRLPDFVVQNVSSPNAAACPDMFCVPVRRPARVDDQLQRTSEDAVPVFVLAYLKRL